MKLLVLHSEIGVLRGGGENFTRNLMPAFVRRGHEVSVAFAADPRGRYPLPMPPGINPIPLPGWWPMALGQGMLSGLGNFIGHRHPLRKTWDHVQGALQWRAFRWYRRRFQCRVEREFARHWKQFDAIYIHGNAPLARNIARLQPTVLRLPGPLTSESAPVLLSINAVCANGDALARMRAFLGDHIIELPIGLDEECFAPGPANIRPVLGWNRDDCVFGYVGRLSHLKGVDLLAAAFKGIARSTSRAKLLIVGHGEEESSIRTALAREITRGIAHIEPGVSHEELSNWYRAMDVLVIPSRYENFSNAMLEAMACGVPVLASDVGGNRMIADTGAGLLFTNESLPSLSDGLLQVLADPPEWKQRGEAAAAQVRGRYSWTESARRLEWILDTRLGIHA